MLRSFPIVFVLLAIFAALSLAGAEADSPTVDEPLHLVRGAVWLAEGDARLSHAHPPLANVLAALPFAGRPIVDVRANAEAWRTADVDELAIAAMTRDYDGFRARLMAGRRVMIALAVAFGVYLYAFCRSRFGGRAAVIALAIFALHPAVLAHAHLVTTDAPVAMASFVALAELSRYLERRGALRLVTTALAIGVALATKFSAAFLVPLVATAGLWACLAGAGRFAGRPLGARLGTFAAHAAFVALVSIAVVGASYRFDRFGLPVRDVLAQREPLAVGAQPFGGRLLARATPLPRLPAALPIPLPYTFIFGALRANAYAAEGRTSWFLGAETMGSPFYFPVLLALKEPLVVLALLALAARRRLSSAGIRVAAARTTTRVFVAAAALYLMIAVFARLNLGVRHVLPVSVIFVVLAANEAARVIAERASRPWTFRAVVALAAASVVSVVAAAPRFIAYANVLDARTFGRVSVVGEDWGQDVGDAARYAEAHHLAPIFYSSYGTASAFELTRAGVSSTRAVCDEAPKTAGWVVIHAAQVARTSCFRWLGLPTRAPDARVNEHVFFYRFDPRQNANGAPPSSAGTRRR